LPLDFLDRIHQKSAGKLHLPVFELLQSKIQGILRHKKFGFFASFLKNEQIINFSFFKKKFLRFRNYYVILSLFTPQTLN